MKKDCERYHCI